MVQPAEAPIPDPAVPACLPMLFSANPSAVARRQLVAIIVVALIHQYADLLQRVLASHTITALPHAATLRSTAVALVQVVAIREVEVLHLVQAVAAVRAEVAVAEDSCNV